MDNPSDVNNSVSPNEIVIFPLVSFYVQLTDGNAVAFIY